MNPTGTRVNPKNWIRFVNFVAVNEVPRTIKMQDYLTSYLGCKFDPNEYVWGVYGNTSINECLFSMKSFADKLGKVPIAVQGVQSRQI